MNDSVSEDPLQPSARQRPSKHPVTDASSKKANYEMKYGFFSVEINIKMFCTVVVCAYVAFDVMG